MLEDDIYKDAEKLMETLNLSPEELLFACKIVKHLNENMYAAFEANLGDLPMTVLESKQRRQYVMACAAAINLQNFKTILENSDGTHRNRNS